MTGDDFRDRYQILKRLTGGEAEGEVPTFLARARGGDRVMVHVVGAAPAARDLLDRLERLPEARRRRVRETTEHRGTEVVVTDFLEDFTSLDAWLPEAAPPGGQAGAGEGAAGADQEPGEFTRLFEQQAPEAEEEPAGSGGAAGEEPGEFTRMFGAAEGGEGPDDGSTAEEPGAVGEAERPPEPPSREPPAEEEHAAEEPPAGGPGDPSAEEPGEFTRMFGAAEGGEGPGSGEPPAAGEPTSGGPADEPPAPRDEPPAEGPGDEADEGPGEFTRMFGSPDRPSEDLPASTGSGGQGRPGSTRRRGDPDDYLQRLGRQGAGPTGGGPSGGSGSPGGPEEGIAGGEAAGDAGDGPDGPGGEDSSGPGRYTRMLEQGSAGGAAGSGAAGSGADAAPGGGAGGGRRGGAGAGAAAGGSGGPASTGRGSRAGGGSSGSGRGSGTDSRTLYVAALAGIVVLALVLVLVLVLVGGGEEDPAPAEEAAPEEDAPAETSALPRQHHQELQLRVREVGGDVDRQVPGLPDGGPVLA